MNGVFCEQCGGPCDTGMNCIRGCKRPFEEVYAGSGTVQPCQHEGWAFKTHGRRCRQCSKLLVDFGD